MTEHVKTEIANGVLTLTLQRPEKKNALTGAMYDALSDALERAETDAAIKVILFQGDGDSFTAGNDLADFASQARGDNSGDSPAHRFILNLGKAKKPLAGSLSLTKKLMRDHERIAAQMAEEGQLFKERLQTPEAREAFTAFAERRPPDFSKLPA